MKVIPPETPPEGIPAPLVTAILAATIDYLAEKAVFRAQKRSFETN